VHGRPDGLVRPRRSRGRRARDLAIAVKAPSTAQSIVNAASASLTAPQSDTNLSNDSVSVTVTSK